jgi:Fe-S oxidoreductase
VNLPDLARDIHSKCVRCRSCQKECFFLQKYGLPGDIAKSILDHNDKANPFECSLCQLCAGVCPEEINPSQMFLSMRTQAVSRSPAILKKYRSILAYEALGRSGLISLYKILEGCFKSETKVGEVMNRAELIMMQVSISECKRGFH